MRASATTLTIGEAVAQIVELIEGEKTRAGEIGFLAENAVELDGMADGFVNLQTKLAAAKNQRAGFLRALRARNAAQRPLRATRGACVKSSSDSISS